MQIVLWLLLSGGWPPVAPVPPLPPPQVAGPAAKPPARVEASVEVVGTTPVDGLGLPKNKIPANVQVVSAQDLKASGTSQVTEFLRSRLAGVNLDEAFGSGFQPDVLFRGFTASPLLGSPQGLAIYQDGVRLNEPFGDTVGWELVPESAIRTLNVIPGSNPLFGLNTLGGALSYRTKDGFSDPGRAVQITGGSFGRRAIEFEAGGHDATRSYFATGSLLGETGWRALSGTHIAQIFSNVGWRGRDSTVDLSVTAGRSDLAGDGTLPVDLLRVDPRTIYTYPDDTRDTLWLITLRGRRAVGATTVIDGTVYYRAQGTDNVNGNTADFAPCSAAAAAGLLCTGDSGVEQVVRDISGNAVPAVGSAGPVNAIDDLSQLRTFAYGATSQATVFRRLAGRSNRLVAGFSLDAGGTRFDSDGRLATLNSARDTIDSGVVQAGSQVRLTTRTSNAALYATDTFDASARLAVTLSGRLNATQLHLRDGIGTDLSGDHSFTRLNPAAGATYQLTRRVNLYGGYSQSSRVPTAVELTCAEPVASCRLPNALLADPPLAQVVASTWEAGIRGGTGRAQVSLGGFATRIANDLLFIGNGRVQNQGYFANVGATSRTGLEARANAHLSSRVDTFAAYTLLSARFDQSFTASSPFHPLAVDGAIQVRRGNRLPGVPTHTLKAGVGVAVTHRLGAGLTSEITSGRVYRGDEMNALAPLPGYALVDGRATYAISARISIEMRLSNILNTRYATFGVLGDARPVLGPAARDPRFVSPGAPRAAWVVLSIRGTGK